MMETTTEPQKPTAIHTNLHHFLVILTDRSVVIIGFCVLNEDLEAAVLGIPFRMSQIAGLASPKTGVGYSYKQLTFEPLII